MRWTTLLLAISLAGPASAAAGPAPQFELQARTPHVSYFSRGGARVDVTRSEAFLEHLSRVFGEAPEGWRLEYYYHGSAQSIPTSAGAHATGLTDLTARRIDSVRVFHPHELVHAVAGRIGRCPVFFAEGIAVALTSDGRWGERTIDDVARDALASGARLEPFLSAFEQQDPRLAYPVAGSFVAFLLDNYGIDAFVVFLRACGPSPRRHETAFRRAFGRSVASAAIAWEAALRDGQTARWTWSDPQSWPSSLRRPSDEVEVANGAGIAAASGDPDSALLMSVAP
jgi:hypothetical protein